MQKYNYLFDGLLEIKASTSIRQILHTVLQVGNFLNAVSLMILLWTNLFLAYPMISLMYSIVLGAY